MRGSSLLVLLSQEFNDIHIVRSCIHYALVIIARITTMFSLLSRNKYNTYTHIAH